MLAACILSVVGGLGIILTPQRAPGAVDDPVIVGAADIASCNGAGDEATAKLIEAIPGTVMAAGDLAYPNGSASDFRNCYDASWGRFRSRTRPAPGNREYYASKNAEPYFDYFGSAAGTRGEGWYSYDVGAWHVVVLNSNCAAVGGCSAGSPQERWLRADLAAADGRCMLAYFHHPLFATLNTGTSSVKAFWQALHDHRASVVVNGHIHGYERFAPQSPSGQADPQGIRQFIVGTGGENLISGSHSSDNPNLEVRDNGTRGVLKLTLHPNSYDWQFIPVAGKSFTDSGSAQCSGPSDGPGPGPAPGPDPDDEEPSRTLEPDADATVSAGEPNAGDGTSRSLTTDGKPESESFLRFTVSGLAGTVTRATLRLYVTDSSDDGPAAYPVASEWSETAITWNSRPGRTGGPLGDLGRIKKGKWVTFDVTTVVTGEGTYAFELAPTSKDGAGFSSREAKSKRPQLLLEMAPATTTTTTTTTTPPAEEEPPPPEPEQPPPPEPPVEQTPPADSGGQ